MKKFLFPILILIVMLFFSSPFFHEGIFITHDGENHIARFAAYFQAFQDWQILPRWAANLNYTYGSPVLLFFYPLPGYIGSLFHAVGIGYMDSFKLVLFLGFLMAPLSFYLFLLEFFSIEVSFVAAILYGLTPYHFLDVYVRGDVGEVLSFIVIPFVFMFLSKNMKKIDYRYVLLGGVSYFFLLLSHNIMSLIFTPFFFLYMLFFAKNKATFFANCALLATGLCLSAYFWFPALVESRFLNKQLVGDFYSHNFPLLSQLLFSAWGFGPDVLKKGGLSPQLGIFNLLVLPVSVVYLFLSHTKRQMIYWLVMSLIGIFMTTSFSQPLWSHIVLLSQFQFPWRFDALSTFALSVLAAFVFALFSKKILYTVAVCILVLAIPYVKVQGYTHVQDSYYIHFAGTTFYHGEATTIWTAGNETAYPKSSFELIGGEGKINLIERNSTKHIYAVNATMPISLLDNTTYFPGWNVYVDNKKTPIEFQDMNHRGLITFAVPEGKHIVSVVFGQTFDRILADIISLFTLSIVVLFFGLQRVLKVNK